MSMVRLFAHQGLRQLRRMLQTQKADDSVMVLIQPYVWKEAIDLTDGVAHSSTPDNSSSPVTILRVEVPPGVTIAYEINAPGRNVAATADSPRLSGSDQFDWSAGWSISMIDVTAVP